MMNAWVMVKFVVYLKKKHKVVTNGIFKKSGISRVKVRSIIVFRIKQCNLHQVVIHDKFMDKEHYCCGDARY